MLKILRKIRKSLIEQGSTRKYILYAFGEIALVVIGILIALQVNNWNQNRKASLEERTLLIEVYSAIKADSITIYRDKLMLEKSARFYENLYRIYNGVLPKDSLRESNIMRRVSITSAVVDVNYPDLAAEVIDHDVKLKVLRYYQALARWREYIDEYNRFIREKMRPFLGQMQFQNYGAQYSDEIDNINIEKVIEALGNPIVQQMFFEAAQRSDGNWPYRAAMEEYLELKIAIEDVIK